MLRSVAPLVVGAAELRLIVERFDALIGAAPGCRAREPSSCRLRRQAARGPRYPDRELQRARSVPEQLGDRLVLLRNENRDAEAVVGRDDLVVAQVRFVEWTAEGRLRHAAFLGLRSDKGAREVRREANESH